MDNYDYLTDEQKLDEAERLISAEDYENAQAVLDAVCEESGRSHYLRGKVFRGILYANEARKQFKLAIKAEPDNEEYREALKELMSFKRSEAYRQAKKQMGATDESAALCCCECCATGLCEAACEAMCDGCS